MCNRYCDTCTEWTAWLPRSTSSVRSNNGFRHWMSSSTATAEPKSSVGIFSDTGWALGRGWNTQKKYYHNSDVFQIQTLTLMFIGRWNSANVTREGMRGVSMTPDRSEQISKSPIWKVGYSLVIADGHNVLQGFMWLSVTHNVNWGSSFCQDWIRGSIFNLQDVVEVVWKETLSLFQLLSIETKYTETYISQRA